MDTQFGFIGLGLIGGSIARALRETDPSCKILAYSRKPELSDDLLSALEVKVLSNAVFSLEELAVCDYIFLCAPVDCNISYLPGLKKIISENTVITDVGSVKSGIHTAAKEAGLSAHFIGGHPMTGSERTGFSNSNALPTMRKPCASLLQEASRILLVLPPLPVSLGKYFICQYGLYSSDTAPLYFASDRSRICTCLGKQERNTVPVCGSRRIPQFLTRTKRRPSGILRSPCGFTRRSRCHRYLCHSFSSSRYQLKKHRHCT